jgi:DNA modification methylase
VHVTATTEPDQTRTRVLGTFQFPVGVLREYHGNPREGDVTGIRTSLSELDQYRTITVRVDNPDQPLAGGEILCGNHTWKAAVANEWETIRGEAVACDEQTAAKIVAADNRWADRGSYDDRKLADLLSELPDLDGTGYDDEDLADLLADLTPAEADDTELDHVPALPAVPVTRDGDVWLLGGHRLMCGDSTDPDAVRELVKGAGSELVTLVHADPPYGMDKEKEGVANDNLYRDKLDDFQMRWWAAWRPHIADNASLYIWGQAPDLWRLWYVGGLARDGELMIRNEIVWDKGSTQAMRAEGAPSSYPVATERCLFLMRGGQFLDNTHCAMTDVWQFSRVTGEERHGHATPKPVALVDRVVKSSSVPHALIAVPFAGTGPEFISATRLGRRVVGMELHPARVDVVCRRWQELTGDEPVLEATGEPHDFTQAEPEGANP